MADNPGGLAVRTKRVFINKIDSYASMYIAKFLSTCVPGESLEGDEKEDEETIASQDQDNSTFQERTFQIVGTVSSTDGEEQSFTFEQYSSDNRHELYQRLMDCDVIVYNITEDANELHEAAWAITALHGQIEHFGVPKIFILVTPLMTWALTRQDQDDPDMPLTEDDFRRRRPHPNYRELSAVEKNVLRLGKTKKSRLTTYVVTSGLQYGRGEGIFHPFFKMAWVGEMDKIPIYGTGTNMVPTIHINDLAGVIQNIIDHKPKESFFFAVDNSKNTLKDIIKPAELEYLNINLRAEASSVRNSLNVQWACETGFVENINLIIAEYKTIRQLLPIKICVLGPPAVGKSTVAQKLSRFYKIQYIDIKDIYTEKIKSLGAENETERKTNETETAPGGLDEQTLHKLVKDKLRSMPCTNHGFVLDGFPKTYSEAKYFYHEEYAGVDDESQEMHALTAAIMPEYIFSLDATDEFLKRRVLNLPESTAVQMGYTQEAFLSKLAAFREANVEDQTVLNYFDELELHPEHIEINDLEDRDSLAVIEQITALVGKPKDYGLTPEELRAVELKADLLSQDQLRQQAAERRCKEAQEAARIAAELEKWKRHVTEVRRQEEELLEARSFPLRNYLVKYVMPTLSQGLLESYRAKADDPVDFLAEYLLRSNSEDD